MVFWSQNPGLGQEKGTEEKEKEQDTASQLSLCFSQPSFSVSLLFPYPTESSLTSLAQGYSCILLGLTALSSGLNNGHGHLWSKVHPIFLS